MRRRVAWLLLTSLAAAGAARAQRPASPRGVVPVLRVDVGTLNPGQLDATTLGIGASAGVGLGPRTVLLARFLRQSVNGNATKDLSRTTHDFVTLVLEQAVGRTTPRQVQYAVRFGGGMLLRPPYQAGTVLTLGGAARYPAGRPLTLVGSVELDFANLPGGLYDTAQWDPLLLRWVPVRTNDKMQVNYGLLLAVEWRPGH